MTTDRYTRLVLGLIALALLANLARSFFPIPNAMASETMRCEIVGKVQVEGKLELDTFAKPVRIELDKPVETKAVR